MSIASVFTFLFETEGADKVADDLESVSSKTEDFAKREQKLLQSLTEEQKQAYNQLSDWWKEYAVGLDSASSKEFLDKEVLSLNAVKDSVSETKEETEKLTKSLDNQDNKLKDLAKSAISLTTVYMGFKKVLSSVTGFAQGGEDLLLMAKNAGIGASELEKYGIALKNYGGGMSSAASTLSNLNSQLQDIKFGKGGAIQEVAIRYGISLYGKNGIATAEEMLVNIAKRMEGLGTQAQLDLGKKLGLDPATLALVQGGVENLNKELKRASELSVYSEEDIAKSRKYQRAMRELQQAFSKIGAIIARFLLPPLTWLTEKLGSLFDYISQHKGLVLTFFTMLGGLLTVLAVKGAIASLAMVGITAPILAIIGLLTALGVAIGLVVDDFVTWLEGGESVIGSLIDWIKDLWNTISNGAVEAFDKALETVAGWCEAIKEMIGGAWDWIVDKIMAVIGFIGDKLSAIGKFFGLGDTEISSNMNIGRDIISQTQNPLSTMPTNQTQNNQSSVKIDEVTVNTQASDSNAIASAIRGDLSNELQDLVWQNAGGTF
jgi:hypothetical protein